MALEPQGMGTGQATVKAIGLYWSNAGLQLGGLSPVPLGIPVPPEMPAGGWQPRARW